MEKDWFSGRRVFPTGGWAAGSSHPGMFSAYDTASVVQEIQKVKEECDYLVVYVHWGIEQNTQQGVPAGDGTSIHRRGR